MQNTSSIFTNHPNRIRYALALVGFVVVVGLFGSLADEVHDGDTMSFDRSVLVHLRDTVATPQLDTFFSAFTDLGGVLAICVITAALALFMWSKRMFSRSVVLLLSMGGIAAAVTVLKAIFARERPSDVGSIITETSFSFPSGHSMGSIGLALAVILLLWPTKWRVIALVIGIGYVLLIGFSRLYLGVHYPTDVVAGWLLGAGWVALVYTIFKSNHRFKI